MIKIQYAPAVTVKPKFSFIERFVMWAVIKIGISNFFMQKGGYSFNGVKSVMTGKKGYTSIEIYDVNPTANKKEKK